MVKVEYLLPQTIIDVLPVNQPPIANDTTLSVNGPNKQINVTLFGTDPEGSALIFSIVSIPSSGGTLSSVRLINGTSSCGDICTKSKLHWN